MTARVDALREAMEQVDVEIVERVAERVRLAREIGRAKRADGMATLVAEREAAVIRRATERARAVDVEPEDVRELFWVLVGICRRAQLADS